MKKIFLFLLLAGFLGLIVQQTTAQDQSAIQKRAVYQKFNYDGTEPFAANPNPLVTSKAVLEDLTMTTIYDMQSNGNSPRHVYYYPDGTIGVVSVRGVDEGSTWGDRGTGYNYFNGTAWGPQPTARIEGSVRTGWPTYQPWGANGECVVSHRSGTAPLVFSTRATKGTGTWTVTEIATPVGASGMLWPRMITSGPDHTTINIICLTAPTANGGTVYNGMDGALLYIRSTDGGATWGDWQQPEGLGPNDYTAFSADMYEFTNPVGDNLAFVVCDSWLDLIIMKSTDNGATWTKSVAWECPGVGWTTADPPIEYYTLDSYVTAAMDSEGKVHILTGLQYASGDADGQYYQPARDGLVYWNENMPVLPEYFDSTYLADNGNIVAWIPDQYLIPEIIASGDFTGLAYYYNSLTSFPAMVLDQDDNVYCFWSGLTADKDGADLYLRHCYARGYNKAADEWADPIDLNGNVIWVGTENVFPTVSQTCSDDYLQFAWQSDDLAGIYLRNTNPAGHLQTSATTNNYYFQNIKKSDILPTVGVREVTEQPSFYVFQNTPNPVQNMTTVKVNTTKPATISMDVYSMIGQNVISMNKGKVNSGSYQFNLDCSNLPSGVYFYTVKIDSKSVTHKMIVE